MFDYLLIFLVSFTVSLLITPIIRKAAIKFKVFDLRESRKVHKKVISKGGGLAIFIAFVFGIVVSLLFNVDSLVSNLYFFSKIIFALTLILILGIYDDIKGTDAKLKFAVQILVAVLLIKFGFIITRLTNPFHLSHPFILGWFGIPVTILWIVGITNAINLIDGLDGLAAGIVSIAALTFFLILIFNGTGHSTTMILASLAGATIGFLKYNFYPAKIFMGDTGSMFLGTLLAIVSISGDLKRPMGFTLLVPAVIVLILPILDMGLAILRRAYRRKPLFQGDKEHIHHKLLNMGFSQRQAVFGLYGLTLLLGLIAFFWSV
jgi:UDP-GlcNAc:undecaprenyl-phosphate GlcNAc-1-phosphate transferase